LKPRNSSSRQELEAANEDERLLFVNTIIDNEWGNHPLVDAEAEGWQAVLWIAETQWVCA
jgi:hypothetical protein